MSLRGGRVPKEQIFKSHVFLELRSLCETVVLNLSIAIYRGCEVIW